MKYLTSTVKNTGLGGGERSKTGEGEEEERKRWFLYFRSLQVGTFLFF